VVSDSLKPHLRRATLSFVFALVLTVLAGAISGLPRCSAVGVLLAPGMFAAAIVFPDGINSNWATIYLVLAVLMNAFLLAWPALWLWAWIGRSRRHS
jgi:hypothetical protein